MELLLNAVNLDQTPALSPQSQTMCKFCLCFILTLTEIFDPFSFVAVG